MIFWAWPSAEVPSSWTAWTTGTRPTAVSTRGDGAPVRGGEGPVGAHRHEQGRALALGLERGGQLGGVLAGGVGGEEGAVVVLGHARQRRQVLGRERRPDQPHHQDHPPEADDEPPEGCEGVHVCSLRMKGEVGRPDRADGERAACQ